MTFSMEQYAVTNFFFCISKVLPFIQRAPVNIFFIDYLTAKSFNSKFKLQNNRLNKIMLSELVSLYCKSANICS